MAGELRTDKMLVRINMPIKLFMQVRKGLGLTEIIPKSHVVLRGLEKHYGKVKLSENETDALDIIINHNWSKRMEKRLQNPNSHLSKALNTKHKKRTP